MKYTKQFLGSFIATIALFAVVLSPVTADTHTVSFENPPYNPGNINGQDSWTKTGTYDSEVETNTYGFASFGSQTLRISNAVTSGAFGDQTFAKPLSNGVGETIATSGSFLPGTRQTKFEMEFDIASAIPTAQQPGLFLSISPDRGDGSRMSYLGFEDVSGGIKVIFYDVQGTSNPANFVLTDLGTYSRTETHNIKLSLDAVEGPSNDVVKVWIDDVLKHTGTSWENYYRYDAEANAEQTPRIIKTVLFRSGGTAVPANFGNGFLFDNVTLTSSTPVTSVSGEITNPATDGATVSGIYNFTATYDDGDEVDDDAVQWAIRQGACNATTATLFGNVDGHSDTFTWDGDSFSTTQDTTGLTPGQYCFVFNPTDDAGQNDVRELRTFIIEEPANPYAVPLACQGNDVTYGTPIVGTEGSDKISGTSGNDLIFALGGSDKVDGKGGHDCIVGGAGSNKIDGGSGNDVILGGDNSDSIDGGSHNDKVYGMGDSDSLKGGSGVDELWGGDGGDSLSGDAGNDILRGEDGIDSAKGGSGNSDNCIAESEKTCEI